MKTLIFISCFLFSACTPALRIVPGDIPPAPVPTSNEKQLGRQALSAVTSNMELWENNFQKQRVEKIVGRLLGVVQSDDHWEVYLVDSEQWNAFTTPGNYIVLFRGLLEDLESDDELAAVIAHEIGHRLANHTGQSAGEKIMDSLLKLGLVYMSSQMKDAGYSVQQQRGLLQGTYMLGRGVLVNPFSHREEYEADLIGIYLAAEAGFDPEAAVKIWQEKTRQGEGGKIKAFFGSHPATENRAETLAIHVTDARKRLTKTPGPKAELVKTYTPRPAAQKLALEAKSVFQSGYFDRAARLYAKAYSKDRRYYQAKIKEAESYYRMGDISAALKGFKQALRSGAKQGDTKYNIACMYALKGDKRKAVKFLAEAISISPRYRSYARSDNDFNSISTSAEFINLVTEVGTSRASSATYAVYP